VSWHVKVIANRYADSVKLMGIARGLRGRDGVGGCEMGMGTAANLEALAARGVEGTDAGPSDLVVAVDTDSADVAEETLRQAEDALSSGGRGGGGGDGAGGGGTASGAKVDGEPPRSLVSARRRLSAPNVALISVAGEYATLEAHRALSAGMHVFLFSDHVSLADELELKQRGDQLGLLVMGPGCGTAMLGNVGLGFANVVTRGPVGIVAAAGTGAQESACLLDAAGVGVSQIVGVGGRDLSAEIGGIMFRQAIAMLAADDATETLLLVSKPPAPEVVASLADDLPDGKRVIAAFVGWEGGGDDAPFEIHDTLEAAARAAAGTDTEDLGELEAAVDAARARSAGRRLLGLFSGGSLAHEAVTLLEVELGPLEGNVGHGPDERNGGHAVLDLGEEEYTQGRPHPMVDLDVRLGFLEAAANDAAVGCVLLDVVLGHGAHTDPATGLADAIAAVAKDAVVLARVCGTAGDPQDAGRQTRILRSAGAIVAPSNAAAARLALRAIAPAQPGVTA
jgi:FdrA protein